MAGPSSALSGSLWSALPPLPHTLTVGLAVLCPGLIPCRDPGFLIYRLGVQAIGKDESTQVDNSRKVYLSLVCLGLFVAVNSRQNSHPHLALGPLEESRFQKLAGPGCCWSTPQEERALGLPPAVQSAWSRASAAALARPALTARN